MQAMFFKNLMSNI